MSAEKDKAIPTVDHKPHAAFFRQSGWLMIANIIAGVMALGVHLLAKKVSEAEYSIFGTMLMVTACVPIMPLQMVFAQQTAGTLATNRERQLAGMIRLGWLWTFILWAIAALVVFAFRNQIMERWELTSAAVLWVTLAAVLMNLWMPLFSGVLQGRQDFFWLGWATIAGGVGRVAVAVLLVLAFHGGATAMIFGAFAGLGAWAGIGIWRSRDLWMAKPEKFDGRGLFKQVAPLMLGFGACQFLFTSDTMYAKAFFSGDEMASYVAAGTLSRALLWLVLPLAAVMFPKIVHASAKSEKSSLLGIVLLGTAILAVCGAAGLCLVGPFVVKLIFTPAYVAMTVKLLPWYAGAMIPLALANVLVNDLMARGKFKVVIPMVLLTMAYGVTLPLMLQKFTRMEVALQTLGAFNLMLLGICVWFARAQKTASQN
ncbi:MAG TPA: lipid II flippase MurJ [Candidatus Paceibacterota bacterium]|nr:lipid II flippase MurJ [Candidatus Paceibacterota bacterium]